MASRLTQWAASLEREADALLRPLHAPGVPRAALDRAKLAALAETRRVASRGRSVLPLAGVAAALLLLVLPGLPRLASPELAPVESDEVLALEDWSESLGESSRSLAGALSGNPEAASERIDDEFRILQDSLSESLRLLSGS